MNKLVGIACAFTLLSVGTQAEENSSLEHVHSEHMIAEALTDIAERSAITPPITAGSPRSSPEGSDLVTCLCKVRRVRGKHKG